MDTKKAITIGVVALILIATFAVIAAKNAKKNSSISSPSKVQITSPANKVQPKAGQESVQTDSDARAIENDLNSVSEEDFSNSNLSDQNVGL